MLRYGVPEVPWSTNAWQIVESKTDVLSALLHSTFSDSIGITASSALL